MRPPFRFRSLLLAGLWSLLFWTVLGLAFAAQLVVTASLEWPQALRFPLHDRAAVGAAHAAGLCAGPPVPASSAAAGPSA
jgi:hypothetical protein